MLAWLTVALAAAPEEVKAQTGLPQFNVPDMAPQLIWLALTFGFMYIVLSRFTLPGIASVIEERQTRIQRDLDEAERLKSETEQAIAAYEQELAEAHGRANLIAAETREKLAAEVAEERNKAEAEVAQQLTEAQNRIEAAKAQAVQHVDAIAVATASGVINKLAGIEASQAEINVAIAMQHSSAGE